MGAMVHMTPVYAKSGEIQDVTAAWYADLFHVRLYLDPYLKGEFPAELLHQLKPVSYTHLDVYKRQAVYRA